MNAPPTTLRGIAVQLLLALPLVVSVGSIVSADDAPRIVNIVNFIRLLEPRSEAITQDVLYQTVVQQAELMQRHRLPGTFLLQYDALMDPRYQRFLKSLPREQFEIGAWWELPQPLVEKAGLKWRGRYPWDWHANVGFVSGYTPAEREKLADVYMADFHAAFGCYPKSVASWFIDEHTLSYLHTKYGIVAGANCKDQVGTDGYTLWGGYWNQAYYPSKLNAYMPAQTAAGQIPVPIFRMLGSDPLRQYDTGLGSAHQGVISLEPVYGDSGGSREWVDWYLHNLVQGECLAFNYAQAGQENSFTWGSMQRGLEYQFPQIAKLRDEGRLRVETLAASGEWFRNNFPTTPATAVTFQSSLKNDQRQTVWFNSRFYRANLLWEAGHLRIRDIHLFDETVESPLLHDKVDSPAVEFHTLPLVDGYLWSSQAQLAGLRPMASIEGNTVDLNGPPPQVTKTDDGALRITWPLSNVAGECVIELADEALTITMPPHSPAWWWELTAADEAPLPFTQVIPSTLRASFQGHDYEVTASQGVFEQEGRTIRLRPVDGKLSLRLVVGE